MEVLATSTFLNERTGKTVRIVSYHEPDKPYITVVVTCGGCGEELSRRDFSTADPNAQEIATRSGWCDPIVYSGHHCREVAHA